MLRSSPSTEDASMAKAIETAIPARIRERHRRSQLASDRRTGAQSRREIWVQKRRWLRCQWRVMIVVAVPTAVAVAFIQARVWQPLAPYTIGALVASAVWAVYTVMLETGG